MQAHLLWLAKDVIRIILMLHGKMIIYMKQQAGYANSEGYKNSFILAPNYPAGKDALTGYKRFFKGEACW